MIMVEREDAIMVIGSSNKDDVSGGKWVKQFNLVFVEDAYGCCLAFWYFGVGVVNCDC